MEFSVLFLTFRFFAGGIKPMLGFTAFILPEFPPAVIFTDEDTEPQGDVPNITEQVTKDTYM